eukprot:3381374-Pyramimonas_sp.AAC.1
MCIRDSPREGEQEGVENAFDHLLSTQRRLRGSILLMGSVRDQRGRSAVGLGVLVVAYGGGDSRAPRGRQGVARCHCDYANRTSELVVVE